MKIRRPALLFSAAALAAALGLTGCAVAATSSSSGQASTASVTTPDDLSAEAILAANSDATTVNDDEWDAATAVDLDASGDAVTITEAGVYRLSGDYTGGVVVDAGEDALVVLILDGADVSNPDGPAIQVTSADDVGIFLQDGTTNTVSDAGASYADDAAFHAAIAADADLTISGTGALSVTASDDGISTSDDLVILSGAIDVTAGDDGLRGHDALVVKDGEVTVSAGTGDALKADQDGDETQGWIEIAGGTLALTAGDDGLDAQTDIVVTGGALTVDAADDGLHSEVVLAIEGGGVVVTDSVEGIESFTISIAGGTIDVTSSDDGLNASGGTATGEGGMGGGMADGGQLLSISGGQLTVDAGGDGLDSNGSLEMTGGTVVVQGPTDDGNGALDTNGAFTISGGTLIAIGSSGMAETPDADSAQGFVQLAASGQAGDVIQLVDADGAVLAEVTAAKRFANVVVSTADVVDGEEYTVLVDGASAGSGTAGVASAGMGGGMGAARCRAAASRAAASRAHPARGAEAAASRSRRQTGGMISTRLARELRDAGLDWTPASGDAFQIAGGEFEGDVFTISDLTVEAHHYPTGSVLGFNGTTEWALDSVALEDALWLPREEQLRELLRGSFRSLERVPQGAGAIYRVTTARSGMLTVFEADDATEAYGEALLALIRASA